MVAVIDGIDRYLRVSTRIRGLVAEDLHDFLNGRRDTNLERRPTVAERVRALADFVPGAVDEYLLLAIDLLGAWRNEFVHGERRHPMPRGKLRALRLGVEWFRVNRGDADIVGLVDRYEASQAPTLADLVTLFSAAQRALANIDERLLLRQAGAEYAVALMEYLLLQEPDPGAMLDRVFQHGGKSASGTVHAKFLHEGGNHDANRRANAPSLTRTELDGLLGIGRKRARDLFKNALE